MNVEHLRSGPGGTSTIWESLAELVAAGQDVVLDRIDLVRSEITEDLEDLAVSGSMIVAAGLVAAAGWIAVAAAIIGWLNHVMQLEAALALIGALHLGAGLGLGAVAVRRFSRRKSRLLNPDAMEHSDG
jgi:hypothetical protein